MSKVAKLVEFSLMVRVIVEEGASDDNIIAASYDKVLAKIDHRELGDNLVSIEDDKECPYGTLNHDEETDGITQKMIMNAKHYLSTDGGDVAIKAMIKAIMEHEDSSKIIDYVDGVLVWDKVTDSFTCDQFIEEIS